MFTNERCSAAGHHIYSVGEKGTPRVLHHSWCSGMNDRSKGAALRPVGIAVVLFRRARHCPGETDSLSSAFDFRRWLGRNQLSDCFPDLGAVPVAAGAVTLIEV